MTAASVLLGWLVARTEVFYADGIRYINQAKVIDQGAWERGLFRSVDHPVYPLAIVALIDYWEAMVRMTGRWPRNSPPSSPAYLPSSRFTLSPSNSSARRELGLHAFLSI